MVPLNATERLAFSGVIPSDLVLELIQRGRKRFSLGLRVDIGEMERALQTEVLKRKVVEGDKIEAAKRKIKKSQIQQLRAVKAISDNTIISLAAGAVEAERETQSLYSFVSHPTNERPAKGRIS